MFPQNVPVTGYKNPPGKGSSILLTQTNTNWVQHKGWSQDKDKGDDFTVGSFTLSGPTALPAEMLPDQKQGEHQRQKAVEHKEVLKTEKTAKCGISTTGNCLWNPTWAPCLGFGVP